MSKKNMISILRSGEKVSDYKNDEAFKNNLRNFEIPYREGLNFPEYITFGVEIETNAIGYWPAFKLRKLFAPWKIKCDFSVSNGSEFISPILKDSPKSWKEVRNVCRFLKDKSKEFDMDPGGAHIHIGAQVFKNGFDTIKRFIKLWNVYEDIIIDFSRGEYTEGRIRQKHFAGSARERIDYVLDMSSKYNIGTDILGYISRKYALNFSNFKSCELGKKNTVEIRCPNGTIEETIWQNNVNFFVKLVDFANSDKFDDEFINRRYENKEYAQGFEGACELADMIFDNSLDKLCFLRQYMSDENEKGKFARREKFFEAYNEELRMVV